MADRIKVGDKAPDFELRSQRGETVRLRDYLGKKAVVLYFYPKDETPGCTKEACAFRDSYEVFRDAGAEVIGISSDDEESHSIFSVKYSLPFALLSDEDGKVRREFGVPSTMGVLPGRVTYVIDKEGIVRNIFSSQTDIDGHINETLKVLKSLN
jgi:peroxiredoxin Q/BCP